MVQQLWKHNISDTNNHGANSVCIRGDAESLEISQAFIVLKSKIQTQSARIIIMNYLFRSLYLIKC